MPTQLQSFASWWLGFGVFNGEGIEGWQDRRDIGSAPLLAVPVEDSHPDRDQTHVNPKAEGPQI